MVGRKAIFVGKTAVNLGLAELLSQICDICSTHVRYWRILSVEVTQSGCHDRPAYPLCEYVSTHVSLRKERICLLKSLVIYVASFKQTDQNRW